MIRCFRPTAVVFAAAVACASPVHAQQTALPEWLAGSWQMEDGARLTEEVWTSGRGGLMLGMSRTVVGTELESWETLRIVRKSDGTLSLLASPKGAAPVEFRQNVVSESAIEFVNGANDYPHKIRYWRQGQLLMAEISKLDGSQPVTWRYRPVAVAP